jgi:hypothetical protein
VKVSDSNLGLSDPHLQLAKLIREEGGVVALKDIILPGMIFFSIMKEHLKPRTRFVVDD